jgi:hypothetical protein
LTVAAAAVQRQLRKPRRKPRRKNNFISQSFAGGMRNCSGDFVSGFHPWNFYVKNPFGQTGKIVFNVRRTDGNQKTN